MKNKKLKIKFNRLLAVTFGMMVLLSSSVTSQAATSDQVTLSTSKPGAGYVVTQSTSLNVRQASNTNSQVIASLPKDSKIMIVERSSNGFYKVQYDMAGHYGYASMSYIREYDLSYYAVSNNTVPVTMRAEQDVSSTPIAFIPSTRYFPILQVFASSDYIVYGNTTGYVDKSKIIVSSY